MSDNNATKKVAGISGALIIATVFFFEHGDFFARILRPVGINIIPIIIDDNKNQDDSIKAEQIFWESVEKHSNVTLYREYLKKYPDGQFKEIALIQLKEIEASAQNINKYENKPLEQPVTIPTELVEHKEDVQLPLKNNNAVEQVPQPPPLLVEEKTLATASQTVVTEPIKHTIKVKKVKPIVHKSNEVTTHNDEPKDIDFGVDEFIKQ
jgi:hypothetical protein